MKLYGKELDDELAKRHQAREERRSQRLTIRNAAKLRGINAVDLLAWERGEDLCPHEEYEDQVGGFPIPKIIFKVCKKCGKIDENASEKVVENNLERAYQVFKRNASEFVKKEKEDLEKK